MSITDYGNYENDKREPNIETLCKLADYYNVSLDYLVGRKYKEADLNITSQRDKIKELINLLNISDLLKLEGYLNCLINNYK